MSRMRAPAAVVLALTAGGAHAQGDEVLVSLYLQVAAVLAVVVVASIFNRLREHRVAILVGCFVGVAAAWWLSWDMPYSENSTYIEALFLSLPVLAATAAWFWRRGHALRRET